MRGRKIFWKYEDHEDHEDHKDKKVAINSVSEWYSQRAIWYSVYVEGNENDPKEFYRSFSLFSYMYLLLTILISLFIIMAGRIDDPRIEKARQFLLAIRLHFQYLSLHSVPFYSKIPIKKSSIFILIKNTSKFTL